jgi:NAD(P)-dependent dehydrogenase (short-subunit alcohol dehydrogenase family)
VTEGPWQLRGCNALVTGGSRGIGLAIARELSDLGASVLIVARTQADIDEAARDLGCAGVAADVTTVEGRVRIAAAVSARGPRRCTSSSTTPATTSAARSSATTTRRSSS